jgi:hypothetical protein
MRGTPSGRHVAGKAHIGASGGWTCDTEITRPGDSRMKKAYRKPTITLLGLLRSVTKFSTVPLPINPLP